MITIKMFTVTLAALLLLTVVTAQTFDGKEATYREPQGCEGQRCKEYQIKMLFLATDTSLTSEQQRIYLNAAEAFEKLQLLDQEC